MPLPSSAVCPLRCASIVAVVALVGSASGVAAQGARDPRAALVAAKTALFDSNFRNDQAGLRKAIAQAEAAGADQALKPLASYYAAWGEWALSHSQIQDGKMADAAATLRRAEQHARAGLALRPDDPEFVLMLANILIWTAVAEPSRMGEILPAVRPLRTRVLSLAPQNPRVLIMDAATIFNTPPEAGGSREKGLARWQQALEQFEREAAQPASDPLVPDWGRALAYGWVCDLYLGMRPRMLDEARAAAQKALQLRPDFWYVTDVVMPRLK